MKVGLFEHGQGEEPASQRRMVSQSWRQACRGGGGVLNGVTSRTAGGTEEAAEKFPGRQGGSGPGDRAPSGEGAHRGGDHYGWAEGKAESPKRSFSSGLGVSRPLPPVRSGTWWGMGGVCGSRGGNPAVGRGELGLGRACFLFDGQSKTMCSGAGRC